MSSPEMRFVIDASVLIKIFVDETLSDKAGIFFARLSDTPGEILFAPDLVYTECANVLWKYTTRFGMTESEAQMKLGQLSQVALNIVPTRTVLPKALYLAYRFQISVYDACYLAVSHLIGVPLVTSDEKLIKAVEGKQQLVISLRNFAF